MRDYLSGGIGRQARFRHAGKGRFLKQDRVSSGRSDGDGGAETDDVMDRTGRCLKGLVKAVESVILGILWKKETKRSSEKPGVDEESRRQKMELPVSEGELVVVRGLQVW